MRILLANYRYFVSGGPERYMFNAIQALESHGHEVFPFSIHYTRNEQTPFSKYFVEPLGSREEVTFHEQKPAPKTVLRSLNRLFYAHDVRNAVVKMVEETQPQVAYVLHYLRKLSPSLLVGLKSAGLPIAVRLSDYAMTCPQAHHLRDGAPCDLCSTGNLLPSVVHRCVQSSLPASVLNYMAAMFHRARAYFDLIDMFVTTNMFMYNKMIEAGFPKTRLCCIPTFVNPKTFHPDPDFSKGDYIVYCGRLDHIKGIHVLISSFAILTKNRPHLNVDLNIIGSGPEDYIRLLKETAQTMRVSDKVHFLGSLDVDSIRTLVAGAQVAVIPSLWYENLPNALLEAFACGTPVLASDIGSLSRSVENGKTGYLFQAGNAMHLAEKLKYCLTHTEEVKTMARNARITAENAYSPSHHLDSLENLFTKLIDKQPIGCPDPPHSL